MGKKWLWLGIGSLVATAGVTTSLIVIAHNQYYEEDKKQIENLDKKLPKVQEIYKEKEFVGEYTNIHKGILDTGKVTNVEHTWTNKDGKKYRAVSTTKI